MTPYGGASTKCEHTDPGAAEWSEVGANKPPGKLAATGSEWEVRLRGRACGGDGWRACGKVETRQEGSDDLGVGDHGNDRALSRAAGTLKNVKREHPVEQVRPAQIPLARRRPPSPSPGPMAPNLGRFVIVSDIGHARISS